MLDISKGELKALVTDKKNIDAACILEQKGISRKRKEEALSRLAMLYEHVTSLVIAETDEDFNDMWDKAEKKAKKAITKPTSKKPANKKTKKTA